MRIDSKDKIAGIPVLKVRNFLRRKHGKEWIAESTSELLDISQDEALNLIDALHAQGYINPVRVSEEKQYWRNTVKGNALANATAAKPVGRPKADKAFAEFMERVNRVNQDPYFLYRVVKVVLFGSYITDAETVNDVDVAIELDPKEKDLYRQDALFEQRRKEADEKGVNLDNSTAYNCWPEIEVLKFLKARSHVINLHLLKEALQVASDHKVVYTEEESASYAILQK